MFQSSSISNSSQNCQYLLFLARLQKTIELHRQNLCEIPAFEPYCAFRIIDHECKNFITATNVQNFLAVFNYNFDPKMVYSAFIMRYDADKDGVLNYPEFLKAVLPFDDPGLRTLVTQKPVIEKINDPLTERIVSSALASYIKEEIISFIALDDRRNEIADTQEFSLEIIFLEIDTKATGVIEFKTFFDYFRKNSIFPYDEEIISILHRLDSDGDGRLTIDDARSFLLISSPPEIQNNRKSDIIQFDNKSIEKMQAAANKVLKSMVSLSHNKQTQNINSNTVNSPTKDGLTSYDYYPYDSIRKFNSPSKNYASPVKNQANESKKNFLYESQTFENENKIAENEKADFLSKMNEKPISNEKISYRNTINPSAELVPFELTAKKNKSIANSSDIENIKDNSIIKAIIHDVEEKNTFMKEIENLCEKNTIEVKIPRDEKNPEILKKMLEYNIKIIKSSAKLEEIKCDLIKKGDFNLIDFFGCLDKNKKGYSTFQEFEHFLKEENMDLDRELIDLFFKKFDQKNLQKLRFIDFERLLTTHDYNENDRKPINIRGFHFKYKELFSVETRKIISKLIIYTAFVEKELEKLRIDIQKLFMQDSNKDTMFLEEMFQKIDLDKDSFISEKELESYLRHYILQIERTEIKTLMRQFDNDKDGKISFLEFKFEYTQRMSSTHNNYFESKQPTKPKQEKIEETIVQSEENSENIKKSTLKKKNSNDQSKLKQEKEDTEFERDQNSVIIEKSLKTSFNESSITKPKIKQENDHIEYQSERKSIFVEKSIKSSIKKKSFAQPILNEKKEPVVFDDPDDPDKVSFLEYKHTKVGISPDLKESSNNDTTKLNKGIELKSTIEIEDGDKSKEESVINLSKKEDSNGEDSEDK